MDTDKHRFKKQIRKSFFALAICVFIYVFSYALNSLFGGYWLIPERDGRDKFSWGLSMHDAIMWQPQFGHEALGDLDLCGALYMPIIRFDRKFIHPTLYMSDKDFEQQFAQLKVAQIHPHWRDEFLAKVTITATHDESNKVIQCVFRYTGSDHPREVVEIKMNRVLSDSLGASPPNGFLEKPYEGSSEFFKTNYVYWYGKLPLAKDRDVILQFPAMRPGADTGLITFFYQQVGNTVDPTSVCGVQIK